MQVPTRVYFVEDRKQKRAPTDPKVSAVYEKKREREGRLVSALTLL